MREVQDQLIELINRNTPKGSALGTVIADSYDSVNGTVDVDPYEEGPNILDVRIQADYKTDSGFVCVPKEGSFVMVSFISDHEAYLSMVSEVTEIVFISKSNGGLVKITPLVEKLNNLEKGYNDLVLKYNTHIHPVSGSSTAVTTSLETTVLIETQKTELENPNISHGDS